MKLIGEVSKQTKGHDFIEKQLSCGAPCQKNTVAVRGYTWVQRQLSTFLGKIYQAPLNR